MSYFVLGWAHLGCDRPAEAVAAFEKALELSRDTIGLGYLGHAYGLAGRKDEARAVLNELLDKSALEDVPQTTLAYVYIGLGDFDRAFESLEKCIAAGDSQLVWFPLAIFSDAFRADPRFQQLFSRL